MQKLSFLIIAALMSCFSFAQTNKSLHNSFICSYYGEPVNGPLTVFGSSPDARAVISEILNVVGLEPKFEIKASGIPNAAAVISSGKRYILYNPSFISALNEAAKDKWASIAILAHEIGHHLNGHTLLGSGSRPDSELEADQFSGFVLRKMGASLEQSQLSMRLLANERSSATHPGKTARLVSIENGWNKAESQITGKQYIARTIPAQQSSAPRTIYQGQNRTVSATRYTLNPKFIQFNVAFTADKENEYFITTSNNLVTVRGDKLITLGKMIRSGIAQYPYALQISGKNEFFISPDGMIVTNTRRQAGYLKSNNKL